MVSVGIVISFVGGLVIGLYIGIKSIPNISNEINGATIKGAFIGGNSNQSYNVSGNSISIGSKLIVDGKVITDCIGHCTVNVTVEGDCHDLTTSNGSVDVLGSVTNNVETSNGDVDVHNGIGGNVSTSNGDVDCVGDIKGKCTTSMGDITTRK